MSKKIFDLASFRKNQRSLERVGSINKAKLWSSKLKLNSGPKLHRQTTQPTSRVALLGIVIVTVVGMVMVSKLAVLQVSGAAEEFRQLAEDNRVRETVAYSPRGRILDRNGVVIADNVYQFRLVATPLLVDSSSVRSESISQVAQILGVEQAELTRLIFADGSRYPLPVLVSDQISHSEAIELEQIMPSLAGFSLDEAPVRKYLSGSGLAHIIGYAGAVSREDLDNDSSGTLLPIDFIGKTGIEKQYDAQLRGVNGLSQVEVDASGAIVRTLATQEGRIGQDIVLSIDVNLQKKLASELTKQMKAAESDRASGVAIHPQTGEVLAMVSLPDYDNNLFAEGISQADFNKLVNDPNEPLLNKVTSAGYTSGSVIKPLVASAGLQEGVVDPNTTIFDGGAIAVVSENDPSEVFTYRGWRPEGLGPMQVRSAIAWSSNIYFYTVGGGHGGVAGLGEERLTDYYRHFGLGEPTGIDLPDEIAGLVPDDEWKQANKGEPWFLGDTYNIAIGQGDLVISPLQINMANASVVNDGKLLEPRLVQKIGLRDVSGSEVKRTIDVSSDNLQIVREGMRQVLVDGTTCSCTFDSVPVVVAGKSGTAETNTPDGRRPHAWFTAFAPYDNPEIMLTIMIEEGVGGSQYAAPVIADTMAQYFNN